ncbi:MAG: GTPase RsgA [Candidatus Altiarchaeota archaeon]|nr:GTPase RsgA [Candidatus Altiarchaeota archaeon]
MGRTGWIRAWKRVERVVSQGHVILEVVDARFPFRSHKLMKLVNMKRRSLIFIINKSDLISREDAEKLAEKTKGILVSTKSRRGKFQLLKLLKSRIREGRELKVGIVGRPNVGKSSLINYLAGRRSAKVGVEAGFTKGEQWIRIDPRILLIDSPGIIYEGESESELVLQNALEIDKHDDPVGVALELMEKHPEMLKKFKLKEVGEAALEELATKLGKLNKGGEANIEEAAKIMVRKWQRS